MPDVGEYLGWLRSQVGYTEIPGNRTRYAALAGHRDGQPWCATFLVAGAKKVGLDLPPGADSAYTPTMEAAFSRAGRLFDTPRIGDFFFLYFESMKRVAHVGVVTWVTEDRIGTCEGNSNVAGSRTGGAVVLRTRNWRGGKTAYIRSFGRPDYGSAVSGSAIPNVLRPVAQPVARPPKRIPTWEETFMASIHDKVIQSPIPGDDKKLVSPAELLQHAALASHWAMTHADEARKELQEKAGGRLGADLRASHDWIRTALAWVRQTLEWLQKHAVSVGMHLALPGDTILPEAERRVGGRFIREIYRIVTAAQRKESL